MPAPGGTYYGEFTTSNPSTGALQNADSPPVATANRNGTDDGTFTLTIVNLSTGRYSVSGSVPTNYAALDRVNISIAATVNSVAGGAVTDGFTVDQSTSTDFSVFQFFLALSTDGRTPATGKTVTATINRDGAGFVACTNAPVEVGNGWYTINLSPDVSFTISAAIQFSASGCDSTLFSVMA